jgi:hypothetical protein
MLVVEREDPACKRVRKATVVKDQGFRA